MRAYLWNHGFAIGQIPGGAGRILADVTFVEFFYQGTFVYQYTAPASPTASRSVIRSPAEVDRSISLTTMDPDLVIRIPDTGLGAPGNDRFERDRLRRSPDLRGIRIDREISCNAGDSHLFQEGNPEAERRVPR